MNGFTPIKDIIYCMLKLKILETFNKLIKLKFTVVKMKLLERTLTYLTKLKISKLKLENI